MKDDFGQRSLRDERTGEGNRTPGDERSEKYKEDHDEHRRRRQEEISTQRERHLDQEGDPEPVSLGIRDMDLALTNELKNKLAIEIQQEGEKIEIPVIWDNQERWTWARKQRRLKTVKEKVLLPLVVIERDDVSKHPGLKPVSGNYRFSSDQKTRVSVQRYSKKNRYDRFSVLNNRKPTFEVFVAQNPKFVKASYNLTVFTEYMWQMDEVIDTYTYNTKKYWGKTEDEKNRYYVDFDSINTEVEMTDDARYVQSDISLEMDGYIVPEESFDEETKQKSFTPATVTFEENIVEDI